MLSKVAVLPSERPACLKAELFVTTTHHEFCSFLKLLRLQMAANRIEELAVQGYLLNVFIKKMIASTSSLCFGNVSFFFHICKVGVVSPLSALSAFPGVELLERQETGHPQLPAVMACESWLDEQLCPLQLWHGDASQCQQYHAVSFPFHDKVMMSHEEVLYHTDAKGTSGMVLQKYRIDWELHWRIGELGRAG